MRASSCWKRQYGMASEKGAKRLRQDDSEAKDWLIAYHEAGHAIASQIVGIPFVRINLDPDPKLRNNPGILWSDGILAGPTYADGRDPWHHHQRKVLIIDFAGRIAEEFIRPREIPFPTLASDGMSLTLHTDEMARSDLLEAWCRYIRIVTYGPGGRPVLESEYPELVRLFEREYRSVSSLLNKKRHCETVAILAEVLRGNRQMTYDEVRSTIETT